MNTNRTNPSDPDWAQRERETLELQSRMEPIGTKYLILSGKGGVGKSTVASNLAMALAQVGQKVGLLDVDLHGPSITKMLGLEQQQLNADSEGMIEPFPVSDTLSVVSIGLLLESLYDAVIWRGPMKYSVIRQFLKDVTWGTLDSLVIDCPPGTGDEPLAVAQLVGNGASAVIVTTPQDVAIADVRRSVSFCQKVNLPIAGIIENMSGLACPHCQQTINLFSCGGGEQLAEDINVPFLGRIPIDPRVVLSGDQGNPFVQRFPESQTTEAFLTIAESLRNGSKKDQDICLETRQMKIAIPVVQGKLSMHFGHCEQFALVEVNETQSTITQTSYLDPPAHEPGVLPRWLHEQGAEMIIAGGMGQRAQGLFSQNGIRVVVGAPAEPPEDIVNAYLAGNLEVGHNVCDH